MADRSPKSSYNRADRSQLKTLVAFVDPDLARRVKVCAAKTDTTVQIIIENAVTDYVTRFEADDKHILKQLQQDAGSRVPVGAKPQVAKPA